MLTVVESNILSIISSLLHLNCIALDSTFQTLILCHYQKQKTLLAFGCFCEMAHSELCRIICILFLRNNFLMDLASQWGIFRYAPKT